MAGFLSSLASTAPTLSTSTCSMVSRLSSMDHRVTLRLRRTYCWVSLQVIYIVVILTIHKFSFGKVQLVGCFFSVIM